MPRYLMSCHGKLCDVMYAMFILVISTIIFGMALITTARLNTSDVEMFQDGRQHPAYQFGIASLLLVLLSLCAQWTLRRYSIKGYHFTRGTLCLLIVTQLVFGGAAVVIFFFTQSVILLVWLAVLPFLLTALYATYYQVE